MMVASSTLFRAGVQCGQASLPVVIACEPRRQGVVFETGPICEQHALRCRIDTPAHRPARHACFSADSRRYAAGPPNLAGRKRTGGDLIRQRLKKVVVVPVDQGYIDGCRLRRLRRARTSESSADDDHPLGCAHKTSRSDSNIMFSGCSFSAEVAQQSTSVPLRISIARERTVLVGEVIGTGQSRIRDSFPFPGCALLDVELQFPPSKR